MGLVFFERFNGKNLRTKVPEHPRTLDWVHLTALAIGGSVQGLVVLSTLSKSQGASAIQFLLIGFLLSIFAAPGWLELVLMWPNRVGGIASASAEAFRPYSPVLSTVTPLCYWFSWTMGCSLTALVAASAIHQWFLPQISQFVIGSGFISAVALISLFGIATVARIVAGAAFMCVPLAVAAIYIPAFSHHVDWHHAYSFRIQAPFGGFFGKLSGAMAGLYIVGYCGPAFESALCHVGETTDPRRQVPKAFLAGILITAIFMIVLPVLCLRSGGTGMISSSLAQLFSQIFAPAYAPAARIMAAWLLLSCMFFATLRPLTGATRALAQLSDDAVILPVFGLRSVSDVPVVAVVATGLVAVIMLRIGNPPWMVAAMALSYLVSVNVPNFAVLVMRRNEPYRLRPFTSLTFFVYTGVAASCVWLLSAVLGFQQFGMPTILCSVIAIYSGIVLYTTRRWKATHLGRQTPVRWSLQTKLTCSLFLFLLLDGAGCLITLYSGAMVPKAAAAMLEDIFVLTAILTLAVNAILPGVISKTAEQIASATEHLANSVLADFSTAMNALSRGELTRPFTAVDLKEVEVVSHDEMGTLAQNFNAIQAEINKAALEFQGAYSTISAARYELTSVNAELAEHVEDLERAESHYRSIYENTVEGIFQTTIDGRYISANPALARIYGYDTVEDLCGDVDNLGSDIYVDANTREEFFQLMHFHDRVVNFEAEVRRRDGTTLWISENTRAVRAEDGSLLYYEGTVVDITPRKRLEDERETLLAHTRRLLAEAVEQADQDPLTGLLNHRAFHKRLDDEFARMGTTGSLAIALIDLNNFKFFNDSYGHSVGDQVLQKVATTMEGRSRSYETVSRFGGDEFAVLVPECKLQVEEFKRLIQQRVGDLFYLPPDSQIPIPVDMAIGVALYPGDGTTKTQLIEMADERLRRAKTSGDGDDSISVLCNTLARTTGGFSMLYALVTAVDAKDRYTRRHSEDVLKYCDTMAKAMKWSDSKLQNLQLAALLHDVGKVGVPDEILRKPNKLTAEEYECLKQHPVMGAVMVGAVPGFEDTLDAIRHHHESWDGKGYPAGLSGEEIPITARVMAVADAFSAMTTDRPYRKGLTREVAISNLEKGAGRQWDPTFVRVFIEAITAPDLFSLLPHI